MYGTPSGRLILALAGLAALGIVAAPFLPTYYLFLANALLIYAILAYGVDILMGWSGQFAFSHMAFFGIGCYTTALLNIHFGLPYLLALPAAVALSAVIGLLMALPAIRLRSIYLALATFAFAEGARWVFNDWTSVTGGANGLRIPVMSVFGFEIASDREAFPVIVVIATVVIVATLMLHRSRFGRELVAVRESEHVAMASGIDVRRAKILAFVVSSLYAGLAGGVYALNHSFVSPQEFGFHGAVLILSMVVVGGLGTIPGVAVGVVLIGLLPVVLQSTLRSILIWQEFIYGLILTLSILFMPRGIWGALSRRLGKAKGASKTPATGERTA